MAGPLLDWYRILADSNHLQGLGLPSALGVATFILPETPNWLIGCGRQESGQPKRAQPNSLAISSLQRLRGPTYDVDAELDAIRTQRAAIVSHSPLGYS